jgi:hypothetical protein
MGWQRCLLFGQLTHQTGRLDLERVGEMAHCVEACTTACLETLNGAQTDTRHVGELTPAQETAGLRWRRLLVPVRSQRRGEREQENGGGAGVHADLSKGQATEELLHCPQRGPLSGLAQRATVRNSAAVRTFPCDGSRDVWLSSRGWAGGVQHQASNVFRG